MTTAAVLDELRHLLDAVANARAALGQGALIDALGLDDAVAQACDAVREIDPAERSTVLPALETLLCEIDGLAGDLRRQAALLAGQRAADAYRSEAS